MQVSEGFQNVLNNEGDLDQLNREDFPEHMFREILNRDPDEDNTRSQVVAIRLPNGDLILGIYPQGDTYEEVTQFYVTV